MTKKTRTILLVFFLVLFFLTAPAIVLYSQGYRLDLENRKISQTGGIYLKIFPKQAEVCLDENLREKTDFFFGSILVENLLPKKHKVEVKKPGYQTWEKTLEVKEKEVTEAKNIVLFPENPDFEVLSTEVKDFWFSPDQKKIVFKEDNKTGWSLKLYETEKNVKSHLMEDKDISALEADLLNLEFSPDSTEIRLEIGKAEEVKYYKIELNKTPPILTKYEPFAPPIENVVTFQKTNGDIFYLDTFGYVFKTDSSFETRTKINEKPFFPKQETQYRLRILGNNVFLQESSTLYKLNPDSGSFENFFDKILDLKISPDNKKIVYFSDYEIWVLFLERNGGSLRRKAGEKLFLIRLSEKIQDVFWLNSDYLVYSAGNQVKIIETDNRDKIQTWTINQTKNPPKESLRDPTGQAQIFWTENNKKLYLLSEEELSRTSLLLP